MSNLLQSKIEGLALPSTCQLPLALLAALLAITTPTHAGETIRIHQRSAKPDVALPQTREDKFPEVNPFARSKSSGQSDVPMAPLRQTPTLNPKEFEELLKRQKNWLWETPKSWEEEQEKSFANHGLKLDAALEQKTEFEEFFQDGPDKTSKNRRSRSNRSSDNSFDFGSESSKRFDNHEFSPSFRDDKSRKTDPDSTPAFRLDKESPFSNTHDQFSIRDFDQQLRSAILTERFEDPLARQQARTQEQERSKAMDDLLKLRLPALTRALDPINSQPDATRKDLNPVTPKRFDEYFPRNAPGITSFDPAKDNLPNRNTLLDAANPRALNGSSLAPAVILPHTQIIPTKPTVFEIPRRRF